MPQPPTAKRIRYFAYKARRKAEIIAKKDGFQKNLSNFCARGSAILHAELEKAGYSPKIYFFPGHIYVHCEGYYVDITAAQFSPKIGRTVVRKESTIEQLNKISRRWEIKWAKWTCNGPQEVRDKQDEIGWHMEKGKVQDSDWKEPQQLCLTLPEPKIYTLF
ncbi:hypothetical protein LCGC14_1165290 [marine sediment metagenome]|uniref:Uncharacterized protein n=1 Tax=marine sediment metagenome TaxID=412755 RepID=A0A0F9MEF3_9ZZZZ